MIQTLTPEQEKQLPVYKDKYIKLGLSTEPVNKDQAEEICSRIYTELMQLPKPKVMVVDSPKAAWDTVRKNTDEKHFTWPYLCGQFDASIFSFYDYCHEVLGVQYSELEKYKLWASTIHLGPVWTMDEMAVVSDKPKHIHMLNGVLHKDEAPAVEYKDGFCVYALNGVRVDKHLAMTPASKLDPTEFAKISNVEVRREFVRKVGMERIIDHLSPEVLDTKGDYELLLVNLGEEVGKWPYLKMKNPSIGVWHLECVGKECRTVQAAIDMRAQSLRVKGWAPSQLT